MDSSYLKRSKEQPINVCPGRYTLSDQKDSAPKCRYRGPMANLCDCLLDYSSCQIWQRFKTKMQTSREKNLRSLEVVSNS
jgi:hypothetical protein